MNQDFRDFKERLRRMEAMLMQGGLWDTDFAQALSKVGRATNRGNRTREPTPELRSMLEHAEGLARRL
ncbi:MAG TPA: hypothetical protein VFF02_09670 [Anaeromyxobacteraceae bacterium]|nr:hypothetical protein [Anaeromyxobacteraceae bacterium]